jgi:hypothetical protein
VYLPRPGHAASDGAMSFMVASYELYTVEEGEMVLWASVIYLKQCSGAGAVRSRIFWSEPEPHKNDAAPQH